MTRKSKRDLEFAVEDLTGDADRSVREWLTQYSLGNGVGVETPADRTDDAPAPDQTVVYVAEDYNRLLPTADIPAWIDVDEDLPIHGGGGLDDPFICADFSGGDR